MLQYYRISVNGLELSRADLTDRDRLMLGTGQGELIDEHHLKIGDEWEILVRINLDSHGDRSAAKGNILVKCPKHQFNGNRSRQLPLSDGEISLVFDQVHQKMHCYFAHEDINAVLLDRFGITEHDQTDPNNLHEGFFELTDDQSKASFRIITDGIVFYSPAGADRSWSFDVLLTTGYRGPIQAKVTSASWAVICKTAPEDDLGQGTSVRLCTNYANLWLLLPQLEQGLKRLRYGRFEDILEDLENPTEMAGGLPIYSARA